MLYYQHMGKSEKWIFDDKNKAKRLFFAIFSLVLFLFLISEANDSFSSVSAGKKFLASGFSAFGKETTAPVFDYAPVYAPKENNDSPSISALSYLGAYLGENGKTTIIAEKNTDDLLPMASITKLMTAIVAYKNYEMEDKIEMGTKVNDWQDSSKRFIPGTVFKIGDIFRALLIESNNDSAMALANKIGMNNFMIKMNDEARQLGMITTHYDNPVGLDPTSKKEIINYSTAKELLVLMEEIIKNYPEILETTSLPQYDIKTVSGGYNHTAVSTNKFLSDEKEKLFCNDEKAKILGGKTGSTDLAKKNLILALESPNGHGYLITIILSAGDSFSETKNLVNWLCENYDWPKPAENVLQNGVY